METFNRLEDFINVSLQSFNYSNQIIKVQKVV